MLGGSPRRGEPRPLIHRRLELGPELGEEAKQLAQDALLWALRVLHEDEQRLLALDRADDIAFGRWLTLPAPAQRGVHRGSGAVYDVAVKLLPQVIRALIAMRLVEGFAPMGQFSNVKSIACPAGVPREKAFRQWWAPRALLLPQLMHAYLIAVAEEPALSSLAFCSDMREGGAGATAAGLYRVNQTTTVSGLGGICGLGGDVLIHYSSMPFTVGFPVVNCERADIEALKVFGLSHWPVSHAEHFELLLRIQAGARSVVRNARVGSRAFGSIRVDPSAMLAAAFPPWLTVGALPVGVVVRPQLAPDRRAMPGGDAALLRLTAKHGLRPIFELFDTIEPEASEQAQRDVFVVDACGNLYSGRQFMTALCSPQRLPAESGLRQETPASLREIGHRRELATFGVQIEPEEVQWFWLRSGLRIAESGTGQGLAGLGVLLRATDMRTVAYVVHADLDDDRTRAGAIARAELHFLHSADHPALGGCAGRVYGDYELHRLKPRNYETRAWLRDAILISNPAVVAAGRRDQVRRWR